MKLDNLMKSWESDEIWENVEKNAICFTVFLFDRHFFVQANFAQKLFFDFKVTYFDKQKQQKHCLEKQE